MSSIGLECSEMCLKSEYFSDFWENVNLHLMWSRFCPCFACEQLLASHDLYLAPKFLLFCESELV